MDKYTQYRKYNLYLIIISLITFLILLAVTAAFNYKCLFAAENEKIDFNTTDVMEDLLSSADNSGKAFDIRDYPIDTTKECRIINFVEYAYSYDKARQSDYALYIYVYNPAVLDIKSDSNQNKISIAIAYDAEHNPSDYHKFNLIFCNKSAGAYDRIFYKFRIDDPEKIILNNVNSNERRYDMGEFELLTNGNQNATAYNAGNKAGSSYRFTGYAKGYGPDPQADPSLSCSATDLETISLTVNNTFYRTSSSDKGKDYQYQLDSVYFSVDNTVLEKYGSLQRIKAEWYEYKTQPIIVTSSTDMYNRVLPYIGQEVVPYNSTIDRGFIYEAQHYGGSIEGFNWAWNPPLENINVVLRDILKSKATKTLHYIFQRDVIENYDPYAEKVMIGGVTSNELYKYIKEYNKSYNTGYLPIKNGNSISADLFLQSVDAGHTFGYNERNFDASIDLHEMRTWQDGKPNFWDNWKEFGFWNTVFGNLPNFDASYLNIPPIVEMTEENLNKDWRDLLIRAEDIEAFKKYCEDMNKENKTTFLFRFSTTDYFSGWIDIYRQKGDFDFDTWIWRDQAYMAQETVFLDFDIIHLTFTRDGVYHVIPVVANPIDIIDDITPPVIKPPVGSGINWLMIIFIALVVILAIVIIRRVADKLPI